MGVEASQSLCVLWQMSGTYEKSPAVTREVESHPPAHWIPWAGDETTKS